MQLDRGLYAPLIVEDPREPLAYDREWIVVLDDWVDGVDGSTPDTVLRELGGGMDMPMEQAGGPTPTPSVTTCRSTGWTLRAWGGSKVPPVS